MKKFFITVVLSLSCVLSVSAQKQTEASTLNLIGKPFESTPNPYHRVDTLVYKGFNRTENRQLRCSAGMAVLFKTNTRNIQITTKWGYVYSSHSTMPISYKGYDLYIKNADGQWQYAASGSLKAYKGEKTETFMLIENMDGTMHECMMYMPRNTGLQVVSLATSGRCLMQPYMLDVLAEVKADAFIFDTFSNPDAELIRERLMPFIDRLIAAHPATPLIFQRTIYRERRSFDTVLDAKERAKAATVEELFAKIRTNPKYKDVYLITPDASDAHETSVDGTHPSSYGYALWAKSIETPVIEILSKYGIK